MPDYPTLILLMIAGAAAYGWWTSARDAAERAALLGRDACQSAGVIWLDQSVHANGLKLRRGDDGRIGITCEFCSRHYDLDPAEVEAEISAEGSGPG